jgi:hypothetical protein
MGSTHIHLGFVICTTVLLTCIAACRPARPPAPIPTETPASPALVIEKVNFSPPIPFEGKTYIDIIGTLPDGCTEIEEIDHDYADVTVQATITTSRPRGVVCSQVITPFKETIQVETGNLYPGNTYTVVVNGKSFSFPWDIEFVIPLTPDPGS